MAITDRPTRTFYPFDVIQQVYEEVARYNFLLNRIGTAGISLLVAALAALGILIIVLHTESQIRLISESIIEKKVNEVNVLAGMRGLEAIRNKESNLVLLDLAMPNFSGLDVVDYLKKENLVESRNIIIFTASSVSNGLFDALKTIGVKGVLKKPVDMNALEELITRFRV